jgi:DNA adenine methylase
MDQYHYLEPFAGAANLFFSLKPKTATLSDLNSHLVECYHYVREKPKQVAAYLRRHSELDSERHYYRVRENYNRSKPNAAQCSLCSVICSDKSGKT